MRLALHPSPRPAWSALLFAMLCVSQTVLADDGARIAPAAVLPKYKTECAACHLAYPPGLLPAGSWQRVMSNLSRHYGTDASLDVATGTELSAWLSANAATHRRFLDAPPEDRITRSAWFVRKHDEVSAATWKRPAIKSPSNCTACHAGAEQGDFNERNIHIPR